MRARIVSPVVMARINNSRLNKILLGGRNLKDMFEESLPGLPIQEPEPEPIILKFPSDRAAVLEMLKKQNQEEK